MKKNLIKIFSIGIVLLLISVGVTTGITCDEEICLLKNKKNTFDNIINSNRSNLVKLEEHQNNESHLIQGVPLIGQDERFFCTIACQTMILNYYGFNLSKYEIFYLMGSGFSLWHYHRLMPFSAFDCSFRPSNSDFLGSLLNIEFQPFYINLTLPSDVVWQKVWSCLKENISLDQPVLISLDVLPITFYHYGIDLPSIFWTCFPHHIGHAITVVGYNERNSSICYNDPQYSILGDEKQGSYNWVDLSVFRTAFERFPHRFPSTYRIKSYKKPRTLLFNKSNIIENGYNRNIKRLHGDFRSYISDIDYPNSYNLTNDFQYGINASKQLKNIFGNGIKQQIYTIYNYKRVSKFGIKNTLITSLEHFIQRVFNKDISYILDCAVPSYKNIYRRIAEEKELASSILSNYSNISETYDICSDLLDDESKLWRSLSTYDRFLRNKGIFISLPKALSTLNQMESLMEDIIQIEERILSLDGNI